MFSYTLPSVRSHLETHFLSTTFLLWLIDLEKIYIANSVEREKKKIYIWGKRDMQESVWNSVTFKSPDNSCHVTGINLYRWESTRMKVCASKEKKKNVWNRYLEAVCATLCFYFFIVKTADFIMCPNNNVLSPPNYWRFFVSRMTGRVLSFNHGKWQQW